MAWRLANPPPAPAPAPAFTFSAPAAPAPAVATTPTFGATAPAAPTPATPAFTFGAPAPAAAVATTPTFGVAPPAAPAPAAPAFTFSATTPAATPLAAPEFWFRAPAAPAPAAAAPAPTTPAAPTFDPAFTSGQLRRRNEEIHALRRLVCGGWMAQWRLLCELGEDPVPPHEGGERGPGGARVDPATLADRFAEDISALDAATAQLAGGSLDGVLSASLRWQRPTRASPLALALAAPYVAALSDTLLQMERASGCLRALAAIEVAPRTPAQLREQLDAASEPPEPLEQARVMLANLDPSALAQSDLDTMQRDLATMKQTLEAASERVQREVVRRELAALGGFRRAEEETCVICMDRSPNVTLVPCGHRITCEQCAERVRECPNCRAPITLRQRTFG